MATLGNKLIHLRHERKLSQAEVAQCLDVSQNAYNKWEADKCKPGADNLQKISAFYEIDISELLADDDKITLSGNNIRGENNIIANTIPNIHIHSSKELISKVLKNQEQISRLLEMEFKLLEEIRKK